MVQAAVGMSTKTDLDTITIGRLIELALEYDKYNGVYPESTFEGWAFLKYALNELGIDKQKVIKLKPQWDAIQDATNSFRHSF